MSDEWETRQLLPAKKNRQTGEYDWAVPQVLSAMIDGIMAPGRALQGEYRYVDLETGLPLRLDESGRYTSIEEDASNPAMAVSPGSLFGKMTTKTTARALTTRASRSSGLYNPPAKAPRPFEADYPSGAVADDTGRLLYDIEGRPFVAEHIVGRRELGGADEPLASPEVLADEYGIPVEGVQARRIGGDTGRIVLGRVPETGAPEGRISVDNSLPAKTRNRAVAHELGHFVNELAGRIDTSGLNTELRQIYNTLNTGQERARHLTGPEHRGYKGEDIPRELVAEAIRAYLADPTT